MTAIRRMSVLEREAGALLMSMGYKPTIVSDSFSHTQFVPYNLIAQKKGSDDSEDNLLVKLKVSLHQFDSPEHAAVFCRDEILLMQKYFQNPHFEKPLRYEVWISIPSNRFQCFEITRDGIRDTMPLSELQDGGTA